MSRVRIEDLKKSYSRGVPVLKGLSFTIQDGEFFFLLGPSGCGKSTLLRILAGLVNADSGKIFFQDTEVSHLPPEKRNAPMVFQNYALWPHLNVFENVAFGLRLRKLSGNALQKKVMETLELVRLPDCAQRKTASLSGGQQQRVALARALAVDPPLLLLDEPLSNLDARLRDTMREELSRIFRERRLTALYVTHERQEALSMADRIAVLKDGEIRQIGTPRELYEKPADAFCAEFLGDVNWLSGEVKAGVFQCAFGHFPAPGVPDGKHRGAIRPERIRLLPQQAGGFPAELLKGSYFGDNCQWLCRACGRELLVRESAPAFHHAGEVVHLEFEPERVLILE